MNDVKPEDVDRLYERLRDEAEAAGYHLNPDVDFTKDLIAGLITNGRRYGYWACPCRLASGVKEEDLDIVCPCDYRDPDLDEYGACYCALYVAEAVLADTERLESIPDRRPGPKDRGRPKPKPEAGRARELSLPVWRCKVCGYLCAREGPPEICPICKATRERFERFM